MIPLQASSPVPVAKFFAATIFTRLG